MKTTLQKGTRSFNLITDMTKLVLAVSALLRSCQVFSELVGHGGKADSGAYLLFSSPVAISYLVSYLLADSLGSCRFLASLFVRGRRAKHRQTRSALHYWLGVRSGLPRKAGDDRRQRRQYLFHDEKESRFARVTRSIDQPQEKCRSPVEGDKQRGRMMKATPGSFHEIVVVSSNLSDWGQLQQRERAVEG